MTYIPLILILIFPLAVAFRKWRRRRASGLFSKTPDDPEGAHDGLSLVRHSIDLCNKAISSGIDCMVSESSIDACRNNRIFDALYSGYNTVLKENPGLRHNEFLDSAWQRALNITWLARRIATFPYSPLSSVEKAGLLMIKDRIMNLSGDIRIYSQDYTGWRLKAGNVKKLLSSHIRRYSYTMSHNDYNAGDFKYTYLLILHNLHTYLVSIQNVFK